MKTQIKFNKPKAKPILGKQGYGTIIFILFLVSFTCATAQQEPIFSFYGQQLNLVNPAVAGLDNGSITLVHRSQWTDVPQAPQTTAFSFGTPWSNGLGGGVSVWSDKTFVEQQTLVSADFSYKVQLNTAYNLYMGLKASGDFYNLNLTGLETFNAIADPALSNISRLTPNAGLGFYLEHKRYFISLSAPRLFENKRAKEEDGMFIAATNRVHYYLSGGASFPLGALWSFEPTAIFRKVGGAPVSAEVTGILSFQERFRFGTGYRSSGSLSGLLMVGVTKDLHIGYAYDTDRRSGLATVGGNSHEILMQFNLGRKSKLAIEQEENQKELPTEDEDN